MLLHQVKTEIRVRYNVKLTFQILVVSLCTVTLKVSLCTVSLNIHNSIFCLHSVFLSERTATAAMYSIN